MDLSRNELEIEFKVWNDRKKNQNGVKIVKKWQKLDKNDKKMEQYDKKIAWNDRKMKLIHKNLEKWQKNETTWRENVSNDRKIKQNYKNMSKTLNLTIEMLEKRNKSLLSHPKFNDIKSLFSKVSLIWYAILYNDLFYKMHTITYTKKILCICIRFSINSRTTQFSQVFW